MYVDDLNIIGLSELYAYMQDLLIQQFDMKILSKTSCYLSLQIQYHIHGSILLHQQAYIQKLLKIFNIDQSHI